MKLLMIPRIRPPRSEDSSTLRHVTCLLTPETVQCMKRLCRLQEMRRPDLLQFLVASLEKQEGLAGELVKFTKTAKVLSGGLVPVSLGFSEETLEKVDKLSFRLGFMGNRSAVVRSLLLFISVKDGVAHTDGNKIRVDEGVLA
jgi:hypothetical protein